MACEAETLEVQNAELSLDGAGHGLDQAIAVYTQAMERLYAAMQALAACKQRLQQQPPAFRAQAVAAIQAMESMKVTVANNAQQCINMLLDAPCPVEIPLTPEQSDPVPAPTPIPEEEETSP
jgi:exonuclease VII small subunit